MLFLIIVIFKVILNGKFDCLTEEILKNILRL